MPTERKIPVADAVNVLFYAASSSSFIDLDLDVDYDDDATVKATGTGGEEAKAKPRAVPRAPESRVIAAKKKQQQQQQEREVVVVVGSKDYIIPGEVAAMTHQSLGRLRNGDAAAAAAAASKDDDKPVKRGRGRPRKDGSLPATGVREPNEDGSGAAAPPAKRNRGRPRKIGSDPSLSEAAPVETFGRPAKRGRGRPRKDGNAASPKEAIPVEAVDQLDKRGRSGGRGRPKKDGNVSSRSESIPVETVGRPARGRGRPRKEGRVLSRIDQPVKRALKRSREDESAPDPSTAASIKNDSQIARRVRSRVRADASAFSPEKEKKAISKSCVSMVKRGRISRKQDGIRLLAKESDATSESNGQPVKRGLGTLTKNGDVRSVQKLSAGHHSKSGPGIHGEVITSIHRTPVSKIHGQLKIKRGMHGPKADEANPLLRHSFKPIFEAGAAVYAAYWPPEDKARDSEPLWYPGVVSSYRIGTKNMAIDHRYGHVLCYKIRFDDGDVLDNILDHFVFAAEDYVLHMRHADNANHSWLGVRNVTDQTSKDGWARHVGWYVATIDGVKQTFSLLCSALRAYDSSVVRRKGLAAKESDLNIPGEFIRRDESATQEAESNPPLPTKQKYQICRHEKCTVRSHADGHGYCLTHQKFAEMNQLVQDDLNSSSTWSCSRCGNANSHTKSRCGSCKGWRGGRRKGYLTANQNHSRRKVVAAMEDKGSVSVLSWKCTKCGNTNTNKSRCSRCNGWKGGRRGSSKKSL